MTDTPETNKAWSDCLAWCHSRDEYHDPQHAALANLATKLERERDAARAALMLAAEWGISSDGYSAEVSSRIRCWVISGMQGPAPKAPDYYPTNT